MKLSDDDLRERMEPLLAGIRPMPPHEVLLALVSLLDDEKLDHVVGAPQPCTVTTSSDGIKVVTAGPAVEVDAITGTSWSVVAVTMSGLIHVSATSTISEWNIDNNSPEPVDRISVEAEIHPNSEFVTLGISHIAEDNDAFLGSRWSGAWRLTLRNGSMIRLPDHRGTEDLAMEVRRRLLNQPSQRRTVV